MKANFDIKVQSLLTLVLLLPLRAGAAPPPADSALSAYAGTWTVTRNNAGAGSKPEELRNECIAVGKYFACEQTVNGAVTGLLLIVPGNQPDHFNTQTVLPDGRATGKGELAISGSKWIFSSIWNSGGKTMRYRTTNTFSDKNHIHFEQEESSDGTHWQVTGSGDDVRVTGAKR
ncbi:MAG: hypothetical protein ACJ746_21800 [Bryobacteraceae bacterium]